MKNYVILLLLAVAYSASAQCSGTLSSLTAAPIASASTPDTAGAAIFLKSRHTTSRRHRLEPARLHSGTEYVDKPVDLTINDSDLVTTPALSLRLADSLPPVVPVMVSNRRQASLDHRPTKASDLPSTYNSDGIVCIERTVTVPCWGGTIFEWTYSKTAFGTNGTMSSWQQDGGNPTFAIVRVEHDVNGLVRFFNGDSLYALYDSIMGSIIVFHESGAFTTYYAAR